MTTFEQKILWVSVLDNRFGIFNKLMAYNNIFNAILNPLEWCLSTLRPCERTEWMTWLFNADLTNRPCQKDHKKNRKVQATSPSPTLKPQLAFLCDNLHGGSSETLSPTP